MISSYVKIDPTAFCSYEDFILGAETLKSFCMRRAESAGFQPDGTIPATIKLQQEDNVNFFNASSVWFSDMGEIADLND